jgi:putative sterol carrier protein
MNAMETPQDAIDQIKQDPSALEGVNGVFQFKITGPNGGEWYLDTTGDEVVVDEGMHEKPDVTFTSTDEDFVAMATGTMPSQMAFMMGKLKVEGNMLLAMQLQKIFG